MLSSHSPAFAGKRTPPGLHGAALGPALVAGLSDAEALAPCVTCAVPAAAAAGGAISKVNTFSIGAIPCSRGPATVRGRAGTIYGAPTCTPVILGAPGTVRRTSAERPHHPNRIADGVCLCPVPFLHTARCVRRGAGDPIGRACLHWQGV